MSGKPENGRPTTGRSHATVGLFDLMLLLPLLLVAATIALVLVGLVSRLAPEQLLAALTSDETLFALALSLETSLTSLAISLAIGVPAAYFLARRRLPGMAILDTLLDLPLVMPPLVAGVGLLFVLGRSSPLPQLAEIGIVFLFSPAGIVLAQSFVATAVVLRAAKAAFAAVDPGYRAVAASLGSAPAWAFLTIDLPLAANGIAAGAVLAWARTLGEFGATLMVAGATRLRTETLPMAIYLNIATGETDVAVAAALTLLAVAFALLLLMRALGGRGAVA